MIKGSNRRNRFAVVGLLLMIVSPLLAGCATVTVPTSTPTPRPFEWRQVALPQGVSLGPDTGFALSSPGGDSEAWLCAPSDSGSYAVWRTLDAGTTWKTRGTVTLPAAPSPVGACLLVVDQAREGSLVLDFSYGGGEGGPPQGSISYYSGDGGATWRELPQRFVSALATLGETTFALLGGVDTTSANSLWGLVATTDGFRTVRPVALPAPLSSREVSQIWGARGTTSLLITVSDPASPGEMTWETEDSGAHWTPVPLPHAAIEPGYQLVLADRPDASARWTLCASITDNTTAQPQIKMQCSTDLGGTWQERPLLSITQSCAACYKDNQPFTATQPCIPATLGPYGALFAACPLSGTVTTLGAGGPQHLYRLAPGATEWQDLGTLPSTMGDLRSATDTVYWYVSSNGDGATGLWVGYKPPLPA